MLASYDLVMYCADMDAYSLNLLGALAVGCCDVQQNAMAELQLPSADLAALLAVHARPGSTVGEIAATTGLTHSGAVRVLDRLASMGAIERRIGLDRRTVALRCTTAGRRKAERALALRQAALGSVVQGLTKRELEVFRTVAQKLLSRLPQDQRDAWRICRLCDHGVCRGTDCPVGSAVP